MLEYHRHKPALDLRMVIHITCVFCRTEANCDVPHDHVCVCGSRMFIWDHQLDVLRDMKKLREVPYVAPQVMVRAVSPEVRTDAERPAPLTGYALIRRQHLRSFPR